MTNANNTNALKHGAYSDVVILPGEDIEEVKVLHRALIEEWNPEGASQHDKVMNITKNMWRKQRFSRHLQRDIAGKQNKIWRDLRKKAGYDRIVAMLKEIDSGASEFAHGANDRRKSA